MLISPLQLERYYFEELSFVHDSAFDSEVEDAAKPLPVDALHVEIEGAHHAENARWLFYRLSVELPPGDGRFSCSFRAKIVGFFRVADDCPDESVALLADVNAPAVLYGSIREAVAALSGRGPLPPVCLPSANFLDLSERSNPANAVEPKQVSDQNQLVEATETKATKVKTQSAKARSVSKNPASKRSR